jgi:hypothetical protein
MYPGGQQVYSLSEQAAMTTKDLKTPSPGDAKGQEPVTMGPSQILKRHLSSGKDFASSDFVRLLHLAPNPIYVQKYPLAVRESTIPDAGHGLFAEAGIPKEAKIILYQGETLDAKQKARRYDDRGITPRYILGLSKDKFIDTSEHPLYLGRYANGSSSKKRANATFNQSGWIVSSRAIKQGDEIIVYYGGQYRLPKASSAEPTSEKAGPT